MNFNENNISYDQELSNDVRVSKFKKFAKENFPDHCSFEFDYSSYLKRSTFLDSLSKNIHKEFLINYETAYFVLICNIPEFAAAEEWIRQDSKSRLKVNEEIRVIKEFYHKWAICNDNNQRRYFGLSTIRLIEKSSIKNNFLNNIYYASILAFDQILFEPDKALELLDQARKIIDSSSMKQEEMDGITYYIQIFKGMCFLKKYFYQEALEEFLGALHYRNNGLNAKYYLLYTYKKKKEPEACTDLINDILESDINLLKISVDCLNPTMLEFIINNASLYNILIDHEFSFLTDDFDKIILDRLGERRFSSQDLNQVLDKLEKINFKELYDKETIATISFIEEICEYYQGNRNLFLNIVSDFLHEKINHIIVLITAQITNKFEKELIARIIPYDTNLTSKEEELIYLQKDLEDVKRNLKSRTDESITQMEKNIKDIVADLELRIENLSNEKKYNPRSTFNSSMVYNFIITLIVFTISGFSGCYNGTIQDVYSFTDVAFIILVSGLKWGSITFLIGMVISMFASGFTIVEKLNEKQYLLNKIQYWKKQLERDIQLIKEDYEKKLKQTITSYSERIEDKKATIQGLMEEKKELQERLTAEYQEKLISQTALLQSIL